MKLTIVNYDRPDLVAERLLMVLRGEMPPRLTEEQAREGRPERQERVTVEEAE